MKTNNTHSNRIYKNLLYCFVLCIMLHVIDAEKSRRLLNKRASTTSECHFKENDMVYNKGGGVVGKAFYLGKLFNRCKRILYYKGRTRHSPAQGNYYARLSDHCLNSRFHRVGVCLRARLLLIPALHLQLLSSGSQPLLGKLALTMA